MTCNKPIRMASTYTSWGQLLQQLCKGHHNTDNDDFMKTTENTNKVLKVDNTDEMVTITLT